VRLGDRGAHLHSEARQVHVLGLQHLLNDDQALGAVGLDGERRPAARAECRAVALHRLLDVVRVVVPPVDDDELLQTPGDEELAVVEDAEIPRSKEPDVRRFAGDCRVERLARRFGSVPVALGHALARHPDLADVTFERGGERARVDDADGLPRRFAATDQRTRPRDARLHFDHRVPLQLRAVDEDGARERAPRADHVESALGQAVAGEERLAVEPARREPFGEPLQRGKPHGLGTIKGDPPAGEIERRDVLVGGAARAERVGEIRRARPSASVLRYGAQPAERLLEEIERREEHAARPQVERLEDRADEPHVVVLRQPAHDDVVRAQTEAALDE
jgi:hypothetical protein